ncbi:hypothetical protein FA95DRAFT_1609041 [Auriscalpium vulgare]|uniref:Uncharacterized protein n=1 Tax=Auriscalpium vulgare TaxID=40419 RepID=A0ACB8RJT8_9AGAM|nr:hypothetical protein FA95DRAFT_1609041 [Auriscalpium vulgare]
MISGQLYDRTRLRREAPCPPNPGYIAVVHVSRYVLFFSLGLPYMRLRRTGSVIWFGFVAGYRTFVRCGL